MTHIILNVIVLPSRVTALPTPLLQSCIPLLVSSLPGAHPATFHRRDVNRVERPEVGFRIGHQKHWSRTTRSRRRTVTTRSTDKSGWAVADSIDYLLLRSAIGRVDHELNVVRGRGDTLILCQQTLARSMSSAPASSLFLRPERDIVLRMESIPKTLEWHESSHRAGRALLS